MNADVAKKKYFTPSSANQTLPLVRAIVGDIVQLYRDVRERDERLERVRRRTRSERGGDPYSEEVDEIERELEKDVSRLRDFVNELMELGVEFKDPSIGLVDFRAQLAGREVYLCWKLGEDEVGFWHELDGGYQGRRALTENMNFTEQPDDE